MKLLELPSSHIFLHKKITHDESIFELERTHDAIWVFKQISTERHLVAKWNLFYREGILHLNDKEKRYKRLHHWKNATEKLVGFNFSEEYLQFKLPKPFLNIDPSFKPVTRRYCSGEADEMFTHDSIRWNITMIEEWIADNKDLVTTETFEVSPDFVNYIQCGFITTNDEHVPHADLNKPVIVVQMHPPFERMSGEKLIDGHHRILKAFNQGIPSLQAYVLTIEQHLPFLMYTLDDTYAYRTLINSWNDMIEILIKKKSS